MRSLNIYLQPNKYINLNKNSLILKKTKKRKTYPPVGNFNHQLFYPILSAFRPPHSPSPAYLPGLTVPALPPSKHSLPYPSNSSVSKFARSLIPCDYGEPSCKVFDSSPPY